MTKKEETYSYKGWLNSDSFVKRAFGVFGYSIVAQLLIMLIMTGLTIIAAIIGVIIGTGFSS